MLHTIGACAGAAIDVTANFSINSQSTYSLGTIPRSDTEEEGLINTFSGIAGFARPSMLWAGIGAGWIVAFECCHTWLDQEGTPPSYRPFQSYRVADEVDR